MAQMWMDEENSGAHMLPTPARKALGDSGLKSTIKKSVLGKLDNVLCNKPYLTPSTGAKPKFPASCAPKISLCKETLQRQHRKQTSKESPQLLESDQQTPQIQTYANNDLYALSADPNSGFDLFDYMDFPNASCLKNCHQSIRHKELESLLSEEQIARILDPVEDEEAGQSFDELPPYSESPAHDIWDWQPVVYHSSDKVENIADILKPQLPADFFYSDFVI